MKYKHLYLLAKMTKGGCMEKGTYDEFNAVEGKCKEGTCVCGTDLCNDGKEDDADAESGIDRSVPQILMIVLLTFSARYFLKIKTIVWKL